MSMVETLTEQDAHIDHEARSCSIKIPEQVLAIHASLLICYYKPPVLQVGRINHHLPLHMHSTQ